MSEPKSELARWGEAIGNFIISGGTRTSRKSESKSSKDRSKDDDDDDYSSWDDDE